MAREEKPLEEKPEFDRLVKIAQRLDEKIREQDSSVWKKLQADVSAELSANELDELNQLHDALLFLNDIKQIADADSGASARGSTLREVAANLDTANTIVNPELPKTSGRSHQQEIELESVGRFQVKEQIGTGGFAKVYRAFDPHLNREVALKIPRPRALASQDSRIRFQREAKAAAVLSHPAIVPVFEAGTDGQTSYIASELCPGQTLKDWLKARDKKTDSKASAEIVQQLAEAAQHAHQRGIVHRDLKPANVMVVDGEPGGAFARRLRITDFGLAKQIDSGEESLTIEGAVVGTPAYMAPEQARGDKEIGPLADVFSLGMILYELLTGVLPFKKSNHLATLRALEVDEVTSPHKLNANVPRDLSAICLKCLEKDTSRRYASAHALSEDLTRWLNGLPVEARSIGAFEKTMRWCRRNPLSSCALSFAFLSLAIGLIATTWQWRESQANLTLANKETTRANEEAHKALEARDLADASAAKSKLDAKRSKDILLIVQKSFVSTSAANAENPALTARQVLINARNSMNKSELDERGKVELLTALVEAFSDLQERELAAELSREEIELRKRLDGPDHRTTLVAMHNLSRAMFGLKQYAEMRELCEEVSIAAETRFGLQDELTVKSLNGLVLSTAVLGRREEAMKILDEKLKNADDSETLSTIAEIYGMLGRPFSDRIKARREAVLAMKEELGENHLDSLWEEFHLANLLMKAGKLKEGMKVLEGVLERQEKILGKSHAATFQSMSVLAQVYAAVRRNKEAIEMGNKVLAISKLRDESRGQASEDTVTILRGLTFALASSGRIGEAMEAIDEACEISEEWPSLNALRVGVRSKRADMCLQTNQIQKAINILEPLNEAYEQTGRKDSTKIVLMYDLARAYGKAERYEDSKPLFKRAIELSQQINGPDHLSTFLFHHNFGLTCMEAGRFDQAIEILAPIQKSSVQHLGLKHLQAHSITRELAISYLRNGELDQAESLLEQLYEHLKPRKSNRWKFFEVVSLMGEVYLKRDDIDKAAPLIIEGADKLWKEWKQDTKFGIVERVIAGSCNRRVELANIQQNVEDAELWEKRLGEVRAEFKARISLDAKANAD